MLLGLIDLLFQDPKLFLLAFTTILTTSGSALLIAITVHEFSHALVAFKLGDHTGKRLGRLSLNPIKHLDPVGTLMLALVGFGWGKPVPFNPNNLRGGYRKGITWVALAGPASNFITAAVCSIPIRIGIMEWHSPYALRILQDFTLYNLTNDILGFIIFFNIVLGIFNLIPISPLDGSKIAVGILPPNMAVKYLSLESYGPLILLGIIMVDWFTNLNLLWTVLGPLVNVVAFIVLGHGI